MKRFIVSATAIAIVGGFATFVETARAQSPQTPKPKAEIVHKVGLIDMAHVFKNYKKFNVLRDDLKAEITESDQQAQAKAEQIKKLQEEMKTLKEGSPDFLAREQQLAKLTSEFETFRKVAQRDFLRKESQIYKTIYLEVTDAVRKYAEYYKYTLIMRFSREELESADNPQDVIRSMNRNVVYFLPDDDITLSVLDYLNREYDRTAGSAPATRTSNNRASNTRPSGAQRQ